MEYQTKLFQKRKLDKSQDPLKLLYDGLIEIYQQEHLSYNLPQTPIDHSVGARGCQEVWMTHSSTGETIQIGMHQFVGATDTLVHPCVPMMRATFRINDGEVELEWSLCKSTVLTNKILSMVEDVFKMIRL